MQCSEELSAYSVLKTADFEQARYAVGEIFCPHRLTPGNQVGSGMIRFNHAPVRALSLNYVDYGRHVEIEPVPFENFYLLQIVRGGTAHIVSNAKPLEIRFGEASFVNPSDQISMCWSEYCRKLIVKIDRTALERFAEQWFGIYLPGPLNFENKLQWEKPELAAVRGLVDLIFQDFENAIGILKHTGAQKHFQDSLFAALLLSPQHSLSKLIERNSPAVPRAVKRAEEFIMAHAAEDISIADLVVASEVSNRTLFESFRRFRGVTPMQYLRRYRLDRAREELLTPRSTASVTEVAMRWNFDQLGRFSSYYAAVFGEKPSETLRKARSL